MPRIYVAFSGLLQVGEQCKAIGNRVDAIQSDFQQTVRQLDWDIRLESDINRTAAQLSRKLDQYARSLKDCQRFIEDAHKKYVALDEYKNQNAFQVFLEEFQEHFGWKELLSGAGYFGTIYNIASDIKNDDGKSNYIKSGSDIYQFLSGAAKTYKNYKKVGNAVGTKKAMTWWAKKITGWKPLGRASTAKNPATRFWNNLTNKTSPYRSQFQNTVNNFKGANGVGKAVASWGAVLFNGVTNWFSNQEEQASSNGTMSDGRVVAETITETVVDVALSYGAQMVVGAAVTTVLGTAAAPGVVVAAVSAAALAGINAGVKAFTGKTTTEWVSDVILDTHEAIGNAIGNAAKNVSESVASWFGKLAFA